MSTAQSLLNKFEDTDSAFVYMMSGKIGMSQSQIEELYSHVSTYGIVQGVDKFIVSYPQYAKYSQDLKTAAYQGGIKVDHKYI